MGVFIYSDRAIHNLLRKLFIFGRPPYTNDKEMSFVSELPRTFLYHLCTIGLN